MGQIQSIQILRFVAATMVVAAHAYHPFAIGAAGVDIFFVISGFIIVRVMSGRQPKEFMQDRFVRIYPIYWIVSGPFFILAFAQPAIDWDRFASSLTLWPIYGDFARPYLAVAWTLCYEMFFYTMAALVLWRPSLARILPALYAAAFIGAYLTRWPLLQFIGNPIILEFGFGAFIASRPASKPGRGAAALVVGVIALAAQSSVALPMADMMNVFAMAVPERTLLWGVPAALIVWGFMQLEPAMKGRTVGLLVYLGGASYSIYLIHPYSWAILKGVGSPLALLLFGLALGIALHQFVERPVLKICREALTRFRRNRAARAMASTVPPAPVDGPPV